MCVVATGGVLAEGDALEGPVGSIVGERELYPSVNIEQ